MRDVISLNAEGGGDRTERVARPYSVAKLSAAVDWGRGRILWGVSRIGRSRTRRRFILSVTILSVTNGYRQAQAQQGEGRQECEGEFHDPNADSKAPHYPYQRKCKQAEMQTGMYGGPGSVLFYWAQTRFSCLSLHPVARRRIIAKNSWFPAAPRIGASTAPLTSSLN